MLKAIIVDDEFPAREELSCMLTEFEEVQIVAAFEDGEEALAYLKSGHQADVIFLDIQMRHMDGITTAWEILQLPQPPYVVFVTGFGEYAIKAFELEAVDYILKPYEEQRLEQTVRKLHTLQRQRNLSNTHVHDFLSRQVPVGKKRLSVWAGDKMVILQPTDIFFAKVDEKGKTMICSTKGTFMTKFGLKEIEEKLAEPHFFRSHKSYLVNLDKVKEVNPWFNNTYMISLEGYPSEQVPVARHYLKEFNKAFEKI
ncbi:MAG: LytTR family DNA-binding domain-containing protein [Negativicutes bacterium]|nr:LytTR family DNA-binding domain-containing protein [Negativicutes bacterium]